MRAACFVFACVGLATGCKDKSESASTSTAQPEHPESGAAGSMAPKLEIERDRFGHIPGRVDAKQLEARKQRLGKTLLKLDTNGDHKVTLVELQDSNVEFLTFEDPKSVDADGDGEITVDELEVAIANRRQQSRDRWKTEIGR